MLLTVLNVVAWLATVVFLVSYHRRAAWWQSSIGVNVVTLTAGLLLIESVGILRRVASHEEADALAVVAYLTLIVAMVLRYHEMRVAQSRRRD